MMRISALIILLLSLRTGTVAQQVFWASCKPIPVEIPAAVTTLRDATLLFSSSNDASIGDLKITNADVRPITRFLILIDTLDREGSHIVTIPFFNPAARTSVPEFETWLRAYSDGSPIRMEPKTVNTLYFAIPLISPQCPSTARLAFVQVEFGDKSRITYGTDFVLDPVLVSVAELPAGDITSVPEPGVLSVRVALDSRGAVKRVESLRPDTPQAHHNWDKIVRGCSFAPRVSSGRATDSILPLVLVFSESALIPWKEIGEFVTTNSPFVQAVGGTRVVTKNGSKWSFRLTTGGATGSPVLRKE